MCIDGSTIVQRTGAESLGIDGHVVTQAMRRGETATVVPLRPKRCDAKAGVHLGRAVLLKVLLAMVGHQSRLHHVGLCAVVARQKNILPRRGGGFREALMTQQPDEEQLLLELSLGPEVTLRQGRGVHLFVQLDLEPLRDPSNHLHLVLCAAHAEGAFTTQGFLHLHVQIHRQISFDEELQQLALLLRLLRAGGAQRGDGGADGADEGREDAHGEQNDPNGEEPLQPTHRRDVRSGRGKLR
mmetsp:Transcript_17098/g.29134  ORF Transcript_17098/g.29134 Transcript_17098/m.29134 type:complete len:241 (-) Transcript_17098:913-1635(-)